MIENIGKTLVLWIAIIIAVVIGATIWLQNSLLFFPNTSIFNWKPGGKSISNNFIVSRNQNQNDQPPRIERQDIIQINGGDRPIEPLLEEEIIIPNGKGGLSAYYFNNFPEGDFLLYSHGTSGNIADRKYVYDIAQEHNLNLFLYDYQGYGKSLGVPTIDGILKDGLTAYDFLVNTKGISPEKIIVFAESLGGPVTANIAKHRKVKGVILMSTFSSMPDLISTFESFGWVRYPLSMISKITLHQLNTARMINQTQAPVVIMHSPVDNYIAYSCGVKNFRVAREPKLLIDIDGTHIAPEITSEQIQQALDFIEQNK